VDCWIGVVEGSDRPIVRLAGRLSVAQVSELLRLWADVAPVELDLTDLVSADSGGIEALRRIRDAGTSLVGAPGYIRLRIDSQEDAQVDRLPLKRRERS
jgi:ABC-type transporter Mla MlaB component